MRITRRDTLKGAAGAVAAAAVQSLAPRRAGAQVGDAVQARAAGLAGRLEADLARHAGFGEKFSGGDGDNATAAWISGRLRDAGYRISESEFDAPFFVPRAAQLSAGAASAPVVAQAPVVVTGPRGVVAPLALVEEGDVVAEGGVGDVRGRIALFVTPFARHAALFPERGIGRTVVAAAEAGAAAVVIVTSGPSGEAVALNAPETPFVPVPTAVLAPKAAAPLVAAARAGAEGTLVVDGEATHRPSKNIVARLERGARWIAISTPRSGWYGCVGERGTGTAAFLEMAVWARERFPGLSVFLMNTGGHEYFFAGSHRVIGEAPPPDQTLGWVHLGASLAVRDAEVRDGSLVMLDTPDPQRSLMATELALSAAAEAFGGLVGYENPGPVRPSAGELSAFTDRGYRRAFAAIGVHRWFHTRLDTLERVDARHLAPVVVAHERALELIVAGA
jgi:hypothetical protein